jgi:hypothetical protein
MTHQQPGLSTTRERAITGGVTDFWSTAMLLLEEASRAPLWNDRDPLIWPALNNFRHYLELELKNLIHEFQHLGPAFPSRLTDFANCALP